MCYSWIFGVGWRVLHYSAQYKKNLEFPEASQGACLEEDSGKWGEPCHQYEETTSDSTVSMSKDKVRLVQVLLQVGATYLNDFVVGVY